MQSVSKLLARITTVASALYFILLFSSCVNTKEAVYFNTLKDTTLRQITPVPETVIQKNDLISITISSLNPEASAGFNQPASVTTQPGYLVNTDGTILLPTLGAIKAEGLTKNQLKNQITNALISRKLLVDPVVTIHFLNFKITVLGEVNHPGVLPVNNEKITILEAIGLAGDLTLQAKRNNILIIREENDAKIVRHINLNTNEIFSSSYYYLKSNDVIYVEPKKAKVAAAITQTPPWVPLLLTGVTFAITIATFLRK